MCSATTVQSTAERDVTARQLEVLRIIYDHQKQHGRAPSIREIGETMGINSTNGVNDHLSSLVMKGCVARSENTARSLVLTLKAKRLLGVVSVLDAAELAYHVLVELRLEPLGERLDAKVKAAVALLEKAGVR